MAKESVMATFLSLELIPEQQARGRSILTKASISGKVFFSGDDLRDPNWVCGQCGEILAEHVPQAALGGGVIKCPICDALNDTLTKSD